LIQAAGAPSAGLGYSTENSVLKALSKRAGVLACRMGRMSLQATLQLDQQNH